MTRVCTKCQMEKDLEADFHRDANHGCGYSYICKECASVKNKTDRERRGPEYWREWRKNNPEKCKAAKRKADLKKYGLTPESWQALLDFQGGKCALFEVCGHSQPGGTFNQWMVDHDHETGKVRGLLCHECNANRVGVNTINTVDALVRYLAKRS